MKTSMQPAAPRKIVQEALIEGELAKKRLDPKRRAALEVLRQKGLDGSLTKKELDDFRRQGRSDRTGLKAYLSALRQVRRRGTGLANLPAEVLGHLDSAIEILTNHLPTSSPGSA